MAPPSKELKPSFHKAICLPRRAQPVPDSSWHIVTARDRQLVVLLLLHQWLLATLAVLVGIDPWALPLRCLLRNFALNSEAVGRCRILVHR